MRQLSPYKKPVTDFLNGYINEKTRSNYHIAIRHFLTFIIPPEIEDEVSNLNKLARTYLKQISRKERDYVHDVKLFSKFLIEKYSPTTTSLYLRNTMVWLEDNGYRVTRRERSRITAQLPPPYPRQEEIELKRKLFRTLYFAMSEDVGALLIVLLSSGMRIGEALRLKKSDINWMEKRPAIFISGSISKTKVPRTTYMSLEASEVLQEYLYHRRDHSELLFNITYARAQAELRKASENIGFSTTMNGRVYGIHWHVTRKWFLSRFSLAANRDIAEHLAGHEGYLSRSYRRYTKKQILKHYIRAERKLSILKSGEY